MKNSTKRKEQVTTTKTSHNYDDLIKQIINLSERVDYIMEGMQTQAAMLKEHQDLLRRVKPRMGL